MVIKTRNKSILINIPNFTLIFIIASIFMSFVGEYVFMYFGLYKDRDSSHPKYYIWAFSLVITLAIILKLIKENSKISKEIKNNSKIIQKVLIIINFLFIPFMIFYIYLFYNKMNSNLWTFDYTRDYLQYTVPIIPRFFWYSSLILGSLFIVDKKNNKIKFLIFLNLILLFLYGSKSLIFFPILSILFSYKIKIKIKQLIIIPFFLSIIVLLSTIYNNFRTDGSLLYNNDNKIFIELFASFFPEQRDGAYLMDIYTFTSFKHKYFEETINNFLISGTNKKIVKNLLNYDRDILLENKNSLLKNELGYDVNEVMNPRVGLIGYSYYFYGNIGLFLNISLYIIGLAFLYYINIKQQNRIYKYFISYLFIIWLWTFNSEFQTNLDFFFYNLYFIIFIKIVIFFIKNYSYDKKEKGFIS